MRTLLHWANDSVLFPARQVYDSSDSVSVITSCHHNMFFRLDVSIPGSGGHVIQGSLWRDVQYLSPTACIIYLHALGTNQFEALDLVPFACNRQLALFSFDFQSHGNSNGNAIPLFGGGAEDVHLVCDHLRSHFGMRRLALWGRSMGACVSYEVASCSNPPIDCIVADSSYASIGQFVADQGKSTKLPEFVVGMLYRYFRKNAADSYHVGFDDDFPINRISHARVPLLLGHGNDDAFVPLEQGRELFARYGGRKKLMYIFPATHNTDRPAEWYETAARFVSRELGVRVRTRHYQQVFDSAELHVGPLESVLPEVCERSGIDFARLGVGNRAST
jgi:pimeloyl-ACP methyl ester carboxylesterase